MSPEKTDALVIRLADFSESSRVVTFFTREFGRVSTLAKGAKRLKGPFEAAIDLLSACRIVFLRKSSSSLDILTEARLIESFRPDGRDMLRLYGGYYVAELLAALTEDYDPHPQLFDASRATLQALVDSDRPALNIISFEVTILREIGQLPAFDACVVCGEPAASGRAHAFWVSQGGLICSECRKQEYKNTVSPGSLAILRQIVGKGSKAIERLAVSDKQLRELRKVTTASICHCMGRRPKMLRYLTPKTTSK